MCRVDPSQYVVQEHVPIVYIYIYSPRFSSLYKPVSDFSDIMPEHLAKACHRRPLKLIVVFQSDRVQEQKRQKEKEYGSRLAKERGAVRSRITANLSK